MGKAKKERKKEKMEKIIENLPNCALFSYENHERKISSPKRVKKALKLVPKVLKSNENNKQFLDYGFGEYSEQKWDNVEAPSQI